MGDFWSDVLVCREEFDMKLAEALLLRADMEKKFASLRERITQNALVQQGEKPHEDPATLMKEAVGILGDLEKLVSRINAANYLHKLPDGRSLMAAIAHRESLVRQHSLVCAAVAGTKKEPDRYSLSEIKWMATVNVSKLQKQADDLAQTIRDLNARIQETNWKVELE